MPARSFRFVLTVLTSITFADRASADSGSATDIYVDGELVSGHLKGMPAGATEVLLRDDMRPFFNGMSWECFVSPPFGFCVQHPTVPVVASRDDGPLLQSFEIFFSPSQTWRSFASWGEIEQAAASGEIALVTRGEIYRVTIPGNEGRASGKMAARESSWGGVKALFR